MNCLLEIFLAAILATTSSYGEDTNYLKAATTSNAHFSTNFFSSLGRLNEGNLVCSPLSAQLALGMLRIGARENTRLQLTSSLHLGENEGDNENGFKVLQQELLAENTGGNIIRIANKAYTSVDLLPDFQRRTKDVFNIEGQRVNFDDESTIPMINKWVANVTEDKIKNLIPKGALKADTKLLLINALYFNASFQSKFHPRLTRERSFFTADDNEVKTPFMQDDGQYKVARCQTTGATALEIPYQGGNLSLVLLKPRTRTGLSELEDNLKTHPLNEILKEGTTHRYQIFIPKFKMEYRTNLNNVMIQMGMGDMFTSRADLSGITGSRNLQVSEVFQKTVIDVNEGGTEAASATGIRVVLVSLPPSFIVDHPFLYYIVYRKTADSDAVTLFSGRYVTPP